VNTSVCLHLYLLTLVVCQSVS